MILSALARNYVSCIGGLLAVTLLLAGCGSNADNAGAPDTDPPAITSGPTVSEITESSATVSWTTSEAATAAVRYGTSPSIGTAEDAELALGPAAPATTHSITLNDLDAVTLYHFRVECADGSGIPAYSDEADFTTDLTAAMYLADGWEAFAAGDYASALASFEGAQVRDPTSAEAQTGEGWCQYWLDDLAGAITAFGAALSLDAAALDARAGRALCSCESGAFTQAEADAQAVLDADAAYLFARSEDFDYYDLRAIIGVSAYEQDDFAGAQTQVDFIAPGNTLNPAGGGYPTLLSNEVTKLYAVFVHGLATQGTRPGKDLAGENP